MRTSLIFPGCSRSPLLGAVVLLATWLGAETVAAAGPCAVTEFPDDISLPGSLRYCVDQVNQGLTDRIVIQAFHWYGPNSPLVFERSATISGTGRIVMPGDEFEGASLFIVGSPASPEPVAVEIEGLELAAVGFAGVRGIDVLAGHALVLESAQLYDFTTSGSGGCVRAGQQSALTISESHLEGCMADDGGAVFSEATQTSVSGSTFVANVAGYNGGAIAIGTANFFLRTLSVGGSTFTYNQGNWGGAIKASGGPLVLEVAHTELVGNVATTRGGGVYGNGTFDACHFEGNEAGSYGGGLDLVAGSTVRDSTLWGNRAVAGGGLAFEPGGGAMLLVENTTAAFNVVKGDGARGAGLAMSSGSAAIRNATFSGNVADDGVGITYGGGLAVLAGKISVAHATFADNAATVGGGIYVAAAGDLTLDSSIVAYSSGSDCERVGSFVSTTSLDTDDTCNVDFRGIDPRLGALDDNGGPTYTRWPDSNDVSGIAECFATEDQRHEPRPAEGCELGAVEP